MLLNNLSTGVIWKIGTNENGRISAGENTRQPKNYYKTKKSHI